jgi:DNA repair exonuclease SbcCD ATPase subunit
MVFDPQISTKVDELKDKVEETKSDMDRLTLMSNVLEKQRKQEEIESLLSRIESDLY